MHWTHAEKLGRLEAVSNSGLSPKSTVQKVHIASSDKPLTRYGFDAASRDRGVSPYSPGCIPHRRRRHPRQASPLLADCHSGQSGAGAIES